MTPLTFPLETPERIRFLNDVFGVDRRLEFAVGQTQYQIRFNPGAEPVHPVCCCQITGTESGKIRVLLSNTSVLTDLQQWLDNAPVEDVPPEIAALVLDLYLSETFETMGSQLGESFALTDVWRETPSDGLEWELPFVLSNDSGGQTRGVLQFEASWRPTIHTLLSLAPSVVSIDLSTLRLPGFVELGRCTLSLEELKTLRSFDVVILDESQYLSCQRVNVSLPGNLRVQCQVAESALLVEEVTVENPLASSTPNTGQIAQEDLQLPVSVHAGRVEPTLGEVRDVAPGNQWEVTVNDAHAVDFLVAGNVVGRGELIRSDERLGVRLLSLAESSLSNLLSPSLEQESA